MRKITIIILIILIYTLTCNIIYNKYKPKDLEKKETEIKNTIKKENTQIPKQEEKPIGYLLINKINLNQPLYSKNSKHNNIEENVTILNFSEEPEKNNSIIFIAAHSGIGEIAYFEELDELNINDEIILYYKDRQYNYIVKNIWEQIKNGSISVTKEKTKQLILTTCSPKKEHYQLIINCIEKK